MANTFSDAGRAATTVPPGTTVAVTGATGFIGGRLVEILTEQGAIVTCLSRGVEAHQRLRATGARLLTLDIADPAPVRAALAGVELVFHCAYDWDDAEWNLRALQALIDGCLANGCHRLVHVSSYVVYQLPPQGEVTEDTFHERSRAGYAHTKRELESLLLASVRESGVPGTILQPTIVYGPFSRPWTIDPSNMLRYGTVVLPDAGEGICNAVYIDDVVMSLILASQRPEAVGQRFLISGPEPITWRRFYEELARAIGVDGPQFGAAPDLAREGGTYRKIMRIAVDPGRLLRRVVQFGPIRKLAKSCTGALPTRLRDSVRGQLFGPSTQRRGYVHLPSLDHLEYLQCLATIRSGKARRELGYAPRFSIDAGMVPTAHYVRDVLDDPGCPTPPLPQTTMSADSLEEGRPPRQAENVSP